MTQRKPKPEKTKKVTQCSKANGKIPKITTVQNDDIVDVSSVELD